MLLINDIDIYIEGRGKYHFTPIYAEEVPPEVRHELVAAFFSHGLLPLVLLDEERGGEISITIVARLDDEDRYLMWHRVAIHCEGINVDFIPSPGTRDWWEAMLRRVLANPCRGLPLIPGLKRALEPRE